jgi:hypothetical protein
VLGVATRVDELDPPDVMTPPFDDVEKQRNIVRATNVLRLHLARCEIEPAGVIPVVTYARFDEHGAVHDDLRWNLDRLVSEVSVWLPDPLERTELAAGEMRRLLATVMDGLTDVMARHVGKGDRHDDDAHAREWLVRWLRGLAPFPARAGETLEAGVQRAAPLGWARDALSAVGAERWSAAAASARVRALGHALRDRLLARVDDAVFAALAATASDAR